MVISTKGVLVQCDIPTKVYILHLNSQRAANDKIVIRELDDTNLLIYAKQVDLVKEELKKHNDSHIYQPPVVDKRLA